MREVELTRRHYFSIWWLMVWRAALGVVVIGLVFDVGLSNLLVRSGVTGEIGPMAWLFNLPWILTTGLNIIWEAIVLRMALKKHYRHFRIALVAPAPDNMPVADAPPL
jgi:hypothetical protein